MNSLGAALSAEFTSALCPETWVVADGTVTPLMRGARLEGSGEEHSEAVAAELAAALEEKVTLSHTCTWVHQPVCTIKRPTGF